MSSGRLTAEELGLRQETYDALVWVRDALDPSIPDTQLPDWIRFDMRDWGGPTGTSPGRGGCGTMACIGGSMQMRMAGLLDVPADHNWSSLDSEAWHRVAFTAAEERVLTSLFYHWHYSSTSNRAAAAAACDRFLAGNTTDPWIARHGRSGLGSGVENG